MYRFTFQVQHRDSNSKARVGQIKTAHGVIKTPAFVPVGTQATVKSLTPDEMDEIGVQLFFVNTYHMYLRPGIEVVEKLGGIHRFMGWDGPIITDSGGFQVFSLGRRRGALVADENFDPSSISGSQLHRFDVKKKVKPDKILSAPRAKESLVKITEDGVEFRSHWDGSRHVFTPESSMDRQWRLGGDIHIAFDDCTSYPVTHEVAKKSLERTHRWAARSLEAHKKLFHSRVDADTEHPRGVKIFTSGVSKTDYQALYGSIQGSVYEDLRKESTKFISSLDFDGIAIGGVAVGESKKEMVDVLDWVLPLLPEGKPRHLLGVGEIDDIFAAVERGVDTFDCVQPTRLARMGRVYTRSKIKNQKSKIQIKNQRYTIDITKKVFAVDISPIDHECACYTCTHFSRAYIHHLFGVRELLSYRLATIHNLWFIHRLVDKIREAIGKGRLLELRKKWL